VGKKIVADHVGMLNYQKGRVLLGVYDTRYGSKKLRVNSLRMRALEAKVEEDDAVKKPVIKKS
jgi:hypothetical protein